MLGLNFSNIGLVKKQDILDKYLQAIYEIDADTIRILFFWKFLLKYQPGESQPVLNEVVINNYHKFYKSLPSCLKILACIVGVPFEIAENYFYDQSIMPGRFQEFLNFLLDNFPFIDDIELWNEPNASDFYLSVSSDSHHRPWNGEEFVRDILVPGCSLLRQRGFKGKVAGITFAENGIVGHENKSPALANILAKNTKFSKLLSKDKKHGQFYFKPQFSGEVMKAITKVQKCQNNDLLKLDALAIHPYPYFANHRGIEYWKHSYELTESFLKMKESYGLSNLETWVTEVGCRSLNVLQDNTYDNKKQIDFIEKYPASVGYGQQIDRLYWYKFDDEEHELRQEKLFGVFDHYYNKKPAFYTLKHLKKKCLNVNYVHWLVDDFSYGVINQAEAVDPNLWYLSKSRLFGFATSSFAQNHQARLLIFPGRYNDDWLEIQSLKYLAPSKSESLKIKLGLNLYSPNTRFKVTIYVDDSDSLKRVFSVSMYNTEDNSSKFELVDSQENVVSSVAANKSIEVAKVSGINIDVNCGYITINLATDEQKYSELKLEFLDYISLSSSLRFILRVTKIGGENGFIELTEFWAYRDRLNTLDCL